DRNDPLIKRGLDYLRGKTRLSTYVRSLQTLAFVEAGFPEDDGRIQRNVNHLLDIRVKRDGKLEGWSYDRAGAAAGRPDNSNTHYALLALHAARGKVKIDRKVWQEVRELFERTQHTDGGWDYTPYNREPPSLTMTTAGLCALLMAGLELNPGRE